MVRLDTIQDYVQKTTETIASVLDMNVIICDDALAIIGDSDSRWVVDGVTSLNSGSILAGVMQTNTCAILYSKSDNPACRDCMNLEKCQVEAMIGVPIEYEKIVVGGIGILAENVASRQRLQQKQEYYLSFITHMSELLKSKLSEKEQNFRLLLLQEQLAAMVNSVDSGIIAVDEKGYLVHCNDEARELLGIQGHKLEVYNIQELIDEQYITSFLADGPAFRNKELVLHGAHKQTHAIISGKKVVVNTTNCGAILYVKRLSDIYDQFVQAQLPEKEGFGAIVGKSNTIQKVVEQATRIAGGFSTILIQGESGTGKEVFAKAIHAAGKTSKGPFIAINCAAIPESLLESELFGYEEGAFSGASKGGRIGRFQQANGGTLFLDEIGEMPLLLQTKLLRVLQDRSIVRLGGHKPVDIDLRVIAATNRDLESMVKANEFREDLYYRLNVIPLYIPPLRERPEDIPVLLDHFLAEALKRMDRKIDGFSAESLEILIRYEWKGNVRELANVVEYCATMSQNDFITAKDLPPKIVKAILQNEPDKNPHGLAGIERLENLEKGQIRNAIKLYGDTLNGKTLAAEALGISLATLYRKLKQYSIT
jgi:sigma-54 dependent transcriptional regulator, acetoin dehydrogenase operon transcriptional activator AcoR